ncbi:MAG: 50S ribosomal protein L25/general stress protein Ctc [Candidatus Omnitrophica bacterium]|nr:50S ribosomal protein L25/general stress protein Ctc [Candidatus Omnitrophota bacterium]
MEEIFLEVEIRKEIGSGKSKGLRDQGFIPAVIYGQEKEAQPIKVGHKQLLQLLHQRGLENVVINLKIKDDKKAKGRPCLIKELQHDPVKDEIIHVDFNEISLTETIKVNVPVVAKGEPAGVKQDGGSLEHILWEIEVECLPTDIPKGIEVDVSALKIGDSIHIKDINFPPNVKVLSSPETVVLSVAAPIKEEVAAPEAVEGEEKQEPEVIKEKKEVPAEGAEEGKEKEEKKEKEKK